MLSANLVTVLEATAFSGITFIGAVENTNALLTALVGTAGRGVAKLKTGVCVVIAACPETPIIRGADPLAHFQAIAGVRAGFNTRAVVTNQGTITGGSRRPLVAWVIIQIAAGAEARAIDTFFLASRAAFVGAGNTDTIGARLTRGTFGGSGPITTARLRTNACLDLRGLTRDALAFILRAAILAVVHTQAGALTNLPGQAALRVAPLGAAIPIGVTAKLILIAGTAPGTVLTFVLTGGHTSVQQAFIRASEWIAPFHATVAIVVTTAHQAVPLALAGSHHADILTGVTAAAHRGHKEGHRKKSQQTTHMRLREHGPLPERLEIRLNNRHKS